MPVPDAVHASTLALARDLLSRPSMTPDDGGCLDLLAGRLTAAGFTCERIDRGAVSNLWARRGEARPAVCLAGHVDVVPPGPLDQWTSDPFVPIERDGALYARGAADMKGPLAAAITAVERVVANRPHQVGSVGLIVTSDEEGAAVDGTAAVVEELRRRGEAFDACLVTESTSAARLGDTIKNGRRGSLNGVLIVRGVQGHIAYPGVGRNPIHMAAPALAELVATEWDRGDEYFPPTSFQVSNVHAGTGANNVIPDSMTLVFNFRFAPVSTRDQLQARVHAVLDRHGLDYAIDWSLSGAPFLTPHGRLTSVLSEAIQSVTGLTPQLSTSGGTSDGRFIAAIAREVAEFGPVNASIHQVNEHLRLADLAPLSRIYERTIAALLQGEDQV
jgi:succinyl-diaminopimelate desuccinylase